MKTVKEADKRDLWCQLEESKSSDKQFFIILFGILFYLFYIILSKTYICSELFSSHYSCLLKALYSVMSMRTFFAWVIAYILLFFVFQGQVNGFIWKLIHFLRSGRTIVCIYYNMNKIVQPFFLSRLSGWETQYGQAKILFN